MTTSLERLVDFMSGRGGDAVDRIREELSDPSHEASRWLAAARTLTRNAIDERALASFELGPRKQVTRRTTGPNPWRLLPSPRLAAAAGAVIATILVAAWWADTNQRRLRTSLELRDAALSEQILKLKDSISRPNPRGSDQTEKALARLEQIESRVADIQRHERSRSHDKDSAGSEMTDIRLALAEDKAALTRLETRLDGLTARGQESKSQPQVDPARIELILTRLRDLAERIARLERAINRPPSGAMEQGVGPGAMRGHRHSELAELLAAASNRGASSQDRTAALQQLTELARTSPDVRQWLKGVAEEPGTHASLTFIAQQVLSTSGGANSIDRGEKPEAHGPLHEQDTRPSENAASGQRMHARKHAHTGR